MKLQDALKVNGKAIRPGKTNSISYHHGYEKFILNYGEDQEPQFDIQVLGPFDIMAEDWEPYKEPCKHEPIAWKHPEKNMPDVTFEHKCGCGAKIRATGWEEV